MIKSIMPVVLLLSFSVNSLFAQNLHKEEDNLRALSNDKSKYVYVDFLNQLDYIQDIGLGEPVANYNAYKAGFKLNKKGDIALKKHSYFTSIGYKEINGIIKSIKLDIDPSKVNFIKDLLISMYGQPDEITYGHLGQSIFYVPHKYYIVLKSTNGMFPSSDRYLDISSVDFLKNTSIYDEFTKVGMVYFDYTPITRLNDATYNSLHFVYAYDKKDNYRGFAVKNDFTAKDWLFIDRIEFLIDSEDVVGLDVEPNRKVDKFITVKVTEKSINTVSTEFIDKILNSKNVKVKISGENGNFKFDLTPLHTYQILTAKYYYDNNIMPISQ